MCGIYVMQFGVSWYCLVPLDGHMQHLKPEKGVITNYMITSGMKAQVIPPGKPPRPAKVTDDSEENLEWRRQSMSISRRPEINSSDEGCSSFH